MADVSLTGIAFTVKGSTDESAVKYFKDLTAALRSYKEVAKNLPSESMDKLFGTLQKFEGLDTSNIERLGKSLKDLGTGVRAFARATNVSFGLTDEMINSIERLAYIANNIPSDAGAKLRDLASGLKAMSGVRGMRMPQNESDLDKMKQEYFDANTQSAGIKYPPATTNFVPAVRESSFPALNADDFSANSNVLNAQIIEISDTSNRATSFMNRFSAAVQNASAKAVLAKKRFDGFLASIKRIAMYRLIRTALKFITEGLQEGVNNAYQYSKALNGPFAKSMDTLATSSLYWRNSVGAALMPLINALTPQIDALVDRVVTLINAINKLFALLGGQSTYTKALKTGKEYAASAAGSAKELQKTLMGFDEINRLNAPNTGGGSAGADYSKMFTTEKLTGFMGDLAGVIQQHLDSIQQAIFPTFALVLGTILTLTGHPGIGIPLMVLGAAQLIHTVATNWNGMTPEMSGTLSAVMGVLGGFFFALGTMLLICGSPGLGIALMIAGATSIATAVAVNWHASDNHVRDAGGTLTGIVSGFLLALGAVALMVGSVGLGIALITAGVVGSIAAVAVNWGYLNNPFRSELATLDSIVSLGLMALGAVVVFTGSIPLGLALIAAGATSFAVNNVDWNKVPANVKSTISVVSSIVSAGLLAVGTILVLTGHLALGLAMVAAGAAAYGLASVTWDAVPEKTRHTITTIMTVLGGALLAVGAILFFTTLSPLGLGMMGVGGMSLALAAQLNWNSVPDKVQETVGKIKQKINDLKSWLGSFKLKFPDFKMPHFSVSTQTGWMGIKYPKIETSWYAQGGFPESGQLFFANESGPEMVGQMGNRNVVANNEQIIEGIKQGVIEALQTAGNGSEDRDIVVNVDGEGLFRIMVNKNNQTVARTGYSPLKV